ncbi:siderophore-interacting protein [Microbacterium sp. YY-01]|uniref:siderophore-interacting protein n=1 Tax=Microbacterium sp. YY-01 TaxID=3421634 RepID=UPI003D16717B
MAKRGMVGVIMRAYGARDHNATVTRTEMLAPHFVRVHLHSPTLLESAAVAPAAFLRFWFPDQANPDHEYQRGYTVSHVDAATGNFAIDMLLHTPEGPASAWARRAKPGMNVQVTPFGSTHFAPPVDEPRGYLLIGDAAATPAINAIIAAVPAQTPIRLYLEQHSSNDRMLPLADHPQLQTHWVARDGEASLAGVIENRDWTGWYVWATPESGSLKHVRKKLRDQGGFSRSHRHLQAYWYYGRAFGKHRSLATENEQTESGKIHIHDEA